MRLSRNLNDGRLIDVDHEIRRQPMVERRFWQRPIMCESNGLTHTPAAFVMMHKDSNPDQSLRWAEMMR
jgi:hypothetical protein